MSYTNLYVGQIFTIPTGIELKYGLRNTPMQIDSQRSGIEYTIVAIEDGIISFDIIALSNQPWLTTIESLETALGITISYEIY